ncbi:MAG TPA: hypothetical protein PKD54_04830, partial [Pirellulaceae bacterium]|nr:hypothetical protein [Pirellulaceae bacterium]
MIVVTPKHVSWPLLLAWALAIGVDRPTGFAQEAGDAIEILASGGKLTGRIDPNLSSGNSRSGQVALVTESGGTIVLDVGSTARIVQNHQAAIDAYHEFVRDLQDTPEDHWRAVEWCLAQSSGRIVFERYLRTHLLRIVDLDIHDKKAAGMLNGLPYPVQLVQHNNRWVDERLLMAAHGYRYDRRWGSHLQSAVSAELRHREQSKKEFLAAYRRWEQQARTMDRLSAGRALDQLVRDFPSALAQLEELAKKEKLPEKRLAMVEAIGTSPTQAAGNALLIFAIEDPEPQIRDRAQSLLLQPHYNRVALVDRLRGYLGRKENDYVQRAGVLMGEIGTFNAVLPLISALRTKHTIPNPLAQPQGQMNMSFGNQGIGFQPGGSGQPKEITREIENAAVLSALRKISQPLSPPDFGFDKSRWSSWYAQIMSSGK